MTGAGVGVGVGVGVGAAGEPLLLPQPTDKMGTVRTRMAKRVVA
jgi:hypothetical protein